MKATYISAIRNSIVTQKSNHFDFHPETEIRIAPFKTYVKVVTYGWFLNDSDSGTVYYYSPVVLLWLGVIVFR